MPTLQLHGIDPAQQPLHETVAVAVKDALFGTIGFPNLKSEAIVVHNHPNSTLSPVYCAGTSQETIVLRSPGNHPWQYACQLAHEFGHMSARADLRFPRKDGLMWIEEMLADCHSLIALHHMRQSEGALKAGAGRYLQELLAARHQAIDKTWFGAQRDALRRAAILTDPARALARHVYASVAHERILRDNRLLIELETGLQLSTFLEQWAKLSGTETSVPSTLRALL